MSVSVVKRWPFLLNWRLCFVLLVPILLLPFVFLDEAKETKFKCLYVLLIMALFWIVEVIPLAMTSFIPIVLLPLLGIQDTSTVSMNFMRETNMLFISGLIISAAVQYSDLHRRIALRVLTIIGSSPAKLLLGVMLTTMFLSMWMLNSAATSMMVPIVLAVVTELKNCENLESVKIGAILDPEKETETSEDPSKNQKWKKYKIMMLLGTAYASNLGGSGVVTGTTPNLVTFELLRDINVSQNGKYMDITFATWMAYAIPPMLLNVLVSWVYLVVLFLGFSTLTNFSLCNRWNKKRIQRGVEETEEDGKSVTMTTDERIHKALLAEYKSLGTITFDQAAVFVLFSIIIMLWMFRDPRFCPGWQELFPNIKIGDSTAAMFIAILFFAIPRDPRVFVGKEPKLKGALLDWKYVQSKLPWDISLLMGAGFAISDASLKSGLSGWIGEQLEELNSLNVKVILIIVMVLTAGVTEILSNAAAANLVIPILLSLSRRLELHPLYLTLPACIACSFAFMLPVAAPSNGIVYSAGDGDLKTLDMMKTGIILNVLCTVVMFALHLTYGNLIFNFDNYEYPPESNSTVLNGYF